MFKRVGNALMPGRLGGSAVMLGEVSSAGHEIDPVALPSHRASLSSLLTIPSPSLQDSESAGFG